jgi:hypothetical protein
MNEPNEEIDTGGRKKFKKMFTRGKWRSGDERQKEAILL